MTDHRQSPFDAITDAADGRQLISGLGSRRQFLGWAGATAVGGSLAATLLRAGTANAAAAPTLAASSGATADAGVQSFRTRPDLHPPQITIGTPYAGKLGGAILTDSHDGPPQSGPLIIDQNGRVVWFMPMSAKPSQQHRAFNVRVWKYQGKPVLGWWEGAVVAGHGEGRYVLYDTSYRKIKEIHAHNGYKGDLHEFVVTEQGTALFTCYGYARKRMRIDGHERDVKYFYGVVQEVDIKSGKLLFQWRSDDHIPLTESYVKMPTDGQVWDYFHINAITIDPADQHLIISSRNTWACYKLDRRSGRVIWKLGGKHGDFKMGRGTAFAFQHDVNMHEHGVMTIFDNEGGPPREASHSKALILSVDERHRRVELAHAYSHTPPVYSDALGSVQPVSGGNTFVGWGRVPYFTLYSKSGKVLFDGNLSLNTNSYRAFLDHWEGMPTGGPEIAVERSGTTATVYASWNGATELGRWSVTGGSSRGAMQQLGTAGVYGFETAITVPDAPAYLAVHGCTGSGKVLGSSRTVTG